MRWVTPKPLTALARPSLTVVMPCYRYGHYLAEATSAALDQAGLDVDVVIVDDASPDGSGDVAASLADEDSRISVIRHDQNRGHILTYATGLAAVKGKYCSLVSADDLLTRDSLSRAVAVMERHPSVGLVYGHPRSFTGAPPTDSPLEARSWTLWRGIDWIAGRVRRGVNPIYSPEAVVRTVAQRQVGDYRAELPHTADFEMWLRLASVCDVARVNGPVQALRRLHGDNMSQTTYGSEVDDLLERARAFEHFFANEGRALRGSEVLADRARAAIVRQLLNLAGSTSSEEPTHETVRRAVEAAQRLDPQQGHRNWHEIRALSRQTSTRMSAALLTSFRVEREVRRRLGYRAWVGAGL